MDRRFKVLKKLLMPMFELSGSPRAKNLVAVVAAPRKECCVSAKAYHLP
jgi:hypothetical protein